MGTAVTVSKNGGFRDDSGSAVPHLTRPPPDLFKLPLTGVALSEDTESSCRGCGLRTILDGSEGTAGLPESVTVPFSRSHAWTLSRSARDTQPKHELEDLL